MSLKKPCAVSKPRGVFLKTIGRGWACKALSLFMTITCIFPALFITWQQTLLNFANFAWLEQPEGNLMVAISRVWYNGSYTIAAKPIKTLELHNTMIQFLIISDIPQLYSSTGIFVHGTRLDQSRASENI